MFLIIELVLLVFGIIALVKKEWPVGGGKKVVGGKAQILGGLAVGILPLVFTLGFLLGVALAVTGKTDVSTIRIAGTALEIGVVIVMGIVLVVLGNKFYAKQEAERTQLAAMAAQGGAAQAPGHPQGQPIPGQDPNSPPQ